MRLKFVDRQERIAPRNLQGGQRSNIDNPFSLLNHEELADQVHIFVNSSIGLEEHLELLINGALQEHYLSRRGAIAIACIFSTAATIGQSFSKSIPQIIGCRIITGLALGTLLSTWQLSDSLGIFVGFSDNLAILKLPSPPEIIWRLEIAVTLIPVLDEARETFEGP
ncbi:hypothetical protein G7Y89_g13576 [Cudoniella acicularis]|uniref:Major facilitator superfamily (MFS) profile domain-containing protein n=1 Tax=Cudoniella acicularis TaxID=354080 RepID=A0A8H4R9D4_9HELO|nr:hypothetical protein G7Y89_g13576 [Cudoniella acicularis]